MKEGPAELEAHPGVLGLAASAASLVDLGGVPRIEGSAGGVLNPVALSNVATILSRSLLVGLRIPGLRFEKHCPEQLGVRISG